MSERVLMPTGRIFDVEMPDLFAVLATAGRVPNTRLAAVLDLLVADGSYTPPGQVDADIYLRKVTTIRGYYALASLMLAGIDGQPTRLVLPPQKPAEGEISPAELRWDEVVALHNWFRGYRSALPAEDLDALGASEPVPAGGAGEGEPGGAGGTG